MKRALGSVSFLAPEQNPSPIAAPHLHTCCGQTFVGTGTMNLRPALTPALPGLPSQLAEASRTTSPHTAPLGERVGERGWPDPPPRLGAASVKRVSPTRA